MFSTADSRSSLISGPGAAAVESMAHCDDITFVRSHKRCYTLLACNCSKISGVASRVPLHLGYFLHPRNGPRLPGRSTIGPPHSGQGSLTSTAGSAFLAGIMALAFSFKSSGIGFVLRHFG